MLWAEALKNLKQRSAAKFSQNLGEVDPWDQTANCRKFMQMMCGTAAHFKRLSSVCQYHRNPCFSGYFVIRFHVLHTNKGSLSYFFCVFCFSSLQSICGFCFIMCHIFPALLLWLFFCCCYGLRVFVWLFFCGFVFHKTKVVPYISLSSHNSSFSAFSSSLSSLGFFSHNLTQISVMYLL